MQTNRVLSALILGALALGPGCKKAPPGGVHLKDVESAFGKEGWKLDGFQPLDAQRFSAQKCVTGPIEGIEAAVCEFGSDEAVRRGKKAAEAWVAQAVTGFALENGRTVLMLADRNKVDPNGKLMNKVTQTYRGIK
jgi:hypothetical protein